MEDKEAKMSDLNDSDTTLFAYDADNEIENNENIENSENICKPLRKEDISEYVKSCDYIDELVRQIRVCKDEQINKKLSKKLFQEQEKLRKVFEIEMEKNQILHSERNTLQALNTEMLKEYLEYKELFEE